ncbi:MAG: type II secretion system F family protein [Beutenbergiaceae bacterium]
MGTVTGLILGAGLLCIWWSMWPQPQRRSNPKSSRTGDLLVQAGMPGVSVPAFVGASTGIAVAAFLLALLLTSAWSIAICFAVIAGLVPTAYVRSKARRRRAELRALWPEVVDDLASAVRAGLSIPEALIALAERGPQSLRPQFALFAADYRASGRFAHSLDLLKARLADPVADRLIEALRITREVGGTDLGRLLRTLSQFLREDLRARGELEARQSWTVNGARLAAAAPWLVLALLSTRSMTIGAYNSPAGVLVLVVGALASVLAYLIMVRLGRLPEDVRVMR